MTRERGSRIAPGGRFGNLRIEKELGRGAFSTVYLARDMIIGRPVALKVLNVSDGAEAAEMKPRALREVRLVGQLASPHIVTLHRVHDLGDAGAALEMEYLDGGTLDDLLECKERVPLDALLRIMRGVLLALDVAHGHGVIHRDVKPGNVLLGTDGSVKLADFGLGRQVGEASLSGSGEGHILGTPRYMSPEVVMGEDATFASDLWSAGVLIYRLLTGRIPFHATNLPNLFLAIQNADPLPMDPDTPTQVQRLVMRCLQKDPAKRPSSAKEVLAVVEGIRPDGTIAATTAQTVPATPARLVGRGGELALLRTRLNEAAAGHGATILMTGETGIGKSALLEEAVDASNEYGYKWIRATLTPVGGLQRPLLEGARRALFESGGPEELVALVTADRFGPAAPLLRGLLMDQSPCDLQGHQQTVWAVEQLLLGLAKESPVGLVIEDAHYCDVEDFRLLNEISLRTGNARVFMSVCYRTHDPERSHADVNPGTSEHVVSQLPEAVHLDLKPLADENVMAILEQLSGDKHLATEVSDVVVHKSDGNPLYVIELYRHLLESGDVVADENTVRPVDKLDQAALPRRFHELVSRRLDGLPPDQRELLDAAAIDGLEFDGEALAATLEIPLLTVLRKLQRLYRERGLVVPKESGYRFAHAAFRDVIYSSIAPDLCREMHNRLAEHLEKRAESLDVDPERLGMHWELGGDPDRAAPHLRDAAMAATKRQEHLRAIDLAERSGMFAGNIDISVAEENADLLFALASCLNNLGRTAEAEAIFDRLYVAANERDDTILRQRTIYWQNNVRFRTKGVGAVDLEALEAVVRELPASETRGRACYLLGVIRKFQDDLDEADRLIRNADEIFLEVGNRSLHSSALDQLASINLRRGRHAIAEKLYARAASLSTAQGRLSDAAASEVNRVNSAFARGALEGLEAPLRRAIHGLALTGSLASAGQATVLLAQIRYAEGDAAGATNAVHEAMVTLESSEYRRALLWALIEHAYLSAARGDLDGATEILSQVHEIADTEGHAEFQVRRDVHLARVNAYGGDLEEAAAAAQRCADAVRGRQNPTLHAEVVRGLCEATLFVLPSKSSLDFDEILGKPARAPDGPRRVAESFVGAARVLKNPEVDPSALQAAADLLQDPPVGDRRFEMRIYGDWFAAEHARRTGDAAEASACAARALKRATELEHVWLQLALIDLHEALGDDKHHDERRVLIERLAAAREDPAASARLLEAWRVCC